MFKHIKEMKTKLVSILCVILIVYIILSIFIMRSSNQHIYVYHEPSMVKLSFGESKYFSTIGLLKVSLEKITKEKYFITYSQITGNQSYFGLTLIIEDLARKILINQHLNTSTSKIQLQNKNSTLFRTMK